MSAEPFDTWAGLGIELASESTAEQDESPFVDVAALLSGSLPEPPRPTVALRQDGLGLLYAGRVNTLIGDPECGKTTIAYAAAAETLGRGGKVLFVDVDHNGAELVLGRLIDFGASVETLSDPNCFRLSEPAESWTLLAAIKESIDWQPTLAVVDSLGEVVPMLGLNSNLPDDYTTAHRKILTRLARAGACVIAIDHLAKGEESRRRGAGGTLAKLRAVDGVAYRVTLREPFAPGRGGAAGLSIIKDRPGGVRASSPSTPGAEQPAGVFVVHPGLVGGSAWHISIPTLADLAKPDHDDVAELDALDPPPRSVDDVRSRLRWGSDRATLALRAWRVLRDGSR